MYMYIIFAWNIKWNSCYPKKNSKPNQPQANMYKHTQEQHSGTTI